MKRNYRILFAFVISVILFSCNGSSNKDANIDSTHTTTNVDTVGETDFEKLDKLSIEICKDAQGLANFFVLKDDVLDMKKDFVNIYKQDGSGKYVEAVPDSFLLDACTISDIATYLLKNKNDGIRIFMNCELVADNTSYPNQQYKNKAGIFIFPTIYDSNISDPNKSKHITDKNSTLHEQACAVKSPYIKAWTSDVENKIAKFDNLYRKNPIGSETSIKKDAFSQAVWIDSCVIFTLDRILKKFSLTHDGICIHLGAYKKIDPKRPSQKYDTQSTMIIAITIKDVNHTSDWDIIDKYMKLKMFAPGAFNHGELCPKICD